ncbi:MAG TPA: DinB family protein [Thermomicrobiales bacterium]|nr:DinB family protein [Thermomicrobiales bacterium]
MDRQTRDTLIAQYGDGFRVVSDALDGVTEAELEAREAPGEWSPRQVVHHLADSEMTSAIRLRRMLVEDAPLIKGYDQEEFAARLHYDRPIHASLAAFKAARETTSEIMVRMTDADWQRGGSHTESGHYTALGWLEIYAVHAHEHADQIRRARARVAS